MLPQPFGRHPSISRQTASLRAAISRDAPSCAAAEAAVLSIYKRNSSFEAMISVSRKRLTSFYAPAAGQAPDGRAEKFPETFAKAGDLRRRVWYNGADITDSPFLPQGGGLSNTGKEKLP